MPEWIDLLEAQVCEPFRAMLRAIDAHTAARTREIRIRAGKPLALYADKEAFLCAEGLCPINRAYIPTQADLSRLLDAMCRHSVYAYEEDIRRGYLTLRGGFRAGLSGHALSEDGALKRLHPISAVNLRIARETRGAAVPLLPHLLSSGGVRSMLLLSPPGLGKTTMLRDAVRLVSEAGYNVALADERGEIAALYDGIPQLDIGPRTDVLDGCPKEAAMSILLRTMSPRVLATDELGTSAEADAILDAANSGVAVLATAHASGYGEAASRPSLSRILPLFRRVAVLLGTPGNIAAIYADGKLIGS